MPRSWKTSYQSRYEFDLLSTDKGTYLPEDSENPEFTLVMLQVVSGCTDYEPFGSTFAARDSESVDHEALFLNGEEVTEGELKMAFGEDCVDRFLRFLKSNLVEVGENDD